MPDNQEKTTPLPGTDASAQTVVLPGSFARDYSSYPETIGDGAQRYLKYLDDLVVIGRYSPLSLGMAKVHLRDMMDLLGENKWISSVDGERLDALTVEYAKLPDRRYSSAPSEPGEVWIRSGHTVQTFMATVRAFFKFAYLRDWIIADPAQRMAVSTTVKSGAPVARKRRSLTLAQAEALLEVGAGEAPGYEEGTAKAYAQVRDKLILNLLTILGLRVSELAGLKFQDVIDDGNQQLNLLIIGKGNLERTVPVPRRLSPLWEEHLRHRSALLDSPKLDTAVPWIFLSTRGNKLSTMALNRIVKNASARVLADPQRSHLYRELTPHALRHTAATLLLASGWDVKTVSKMLGHSSVAVTSAYLDELDGELADAVNAHPILAIHS